MELLQPLISVLSIFVSVLLTIIGYQYKVARRQSKLLNAFQLLIHEPGVLRKLYLHMLVDDPRQATKQRHELEQRISHLEDIMQLIAKKKNIQELIDDKVDKIKQ